MTLGALCIASLSVEGAAGKCDADATPALALATQPLTYDVVPVLYTRSPAKFRQLLLQTTTPAEATRVMHLGDSTNTDIIGAGAQHMNWRRWMWHQYHGHTPATQLSRSTNFGQLPGAEWMMMGGVVEPQPAAVPDTFLPPGHHHAAGTGYSFRVSEFGPLGLFLFLNHHNDNDGSMFCLSNPRGFYHVPEAVAIGDPAFADGSLHAQSSLIDIASGVRIEVLAVSRPGSASSVRWFSLPQTQSQFCQSSIYAPVVEGGLLLGGAQSLDAPIGTAHRAQSPVLAPLTGNQRFHFVNVTGSSSIPSASVQIIGARFISENPRGVVIDSFSSGGYDAYSLRLHHPNCGFIFKAGGYHLAWMSYGINDEMLQHTTAHFEEDIRNTINFVRTAMNDPAFPIVLESHSYTNVSTLEGNRYAGVLYRIAVDDPNVMILNSRRVAMERFGWGSGSQESYTSDGIHYNGLGAQVFSKSAVQTIQARLGNHIVTEEFLRQDNGPRGKDTTLTLNQPLNDCGECVSMYVGTSEGGSNVQRALISIRDLNYIPSGSSIISAELLLTTSLISTSAQPMQFNLLSTEYWTEGGNGTGASWDNSSNSPPTPWATPGGDFTTAGQLTGFVLPVSFSPQTLSYNILPIVQQAHAGQQSITTIMIKRSNETGVVARAGFFTSDHSVASQRPMLRIRYIPMLPECRADIAPNGGDRIVDIDDLVEVITSWGTNNGPADIAPPGGNGVVNIDDLVAVITSWGLCP